MFISNQVACEDGFKPKMLRLAILYFTCIVHDLQLDSRDHVLALQFSFSSSSYSTLY